MPIFRHGGGCIFAPDPRLRATEATGLLWRPEHLVDCVCLVPALSGAGDASRIIFDPARWPSPLDVFFAADGLHLLAGGGRIRPVRLWLPRRRLLPRLDTPFAFYIQPDAYARERTEVALHFLRIVTGASRPHTMPRPLPPHPVWPQRDAVRLAAMLHAIDLQGAGLGQRAIARAVLGASPEADWASSHQRSALRRLLSDGNRYVATDYLTLLRPPIRQGRR